MPGCGCFTSSVPGCSGRVFIYLFILGWTCLTWRIHNYIYHMSTAVAAKWNWPIFATPRKWHVQTYLHSLLLIKSQDRKNCSLFTIKITFCSPDMPGLVIFTSDRLRLHGAGNGCCLHVCLAALNCILFYILQQWEAVVLCLQIWRLSHYSCTTTLFFSNVSLKDKWPILYNTIQCLM